MPEIVESVDACPFCGMQATFWEDNGYFSLGCGNEECYIAPKTFWHMNRKIIIAAWNKREG